MPFPATDADAVVVGQAVRRPDEQRLAVGAVEAYPPSLEVEGELEGGDRQRQAAGEDDESG